MTAEPTMELIRNLASYPSETEWIEFKLNQCSGEMIGSDISALANAAAYLGRPAGYLVWGVEDETHDLVGTSFDPYETKVGKGGRSGRNKESQADSSHASRTAKGQGNQLLNPWLMSQVSRNVDYDFTVIEDALGRFVVLTVPAASRQPVTFQDKAFIRRGNSTVELKRASALEQELWRRLQREGFEGLIALEDVSASKVRDYLDVDAFFRLTKLRRPSTERDVMETLSGQKLLKPQDDGRFAITNLGALLLAHNLNDFRGLQSRPIQVVKFAGRGSEEIIGRPNLDKGYGLALAEAEAYIMGAVPAHEEASGVFRHIVHDFPHLVVRELLTNAVIHQDLSDPYAGPFVGIHEGRIEFGNPGESLVAPERVLNDLPRERNKALANMLRLMGLCEASGTGWDLVVRLCEKRYLPAPKMRSSEASGTVVTLFSAQSYDNMNASERLDAVYWHACLRYANGHELTNQSLRERFGARGEEPSTSAISRLIRTACTKNLIRVSDGESSRKYRSYVPYWA